jgi:biopolymer transport protein ExbD
MTMKNTYPVLEKEQTDINLTPMLDVVFILLIFFVVTATFTREFGVDVYNPASAIPVPDDVQTISIVIEEDGSFHVNGRVLAEGSLTPYVMHLRAEFPDAGFSVLVSPEAYVEATVAAIDAGRSAGFERIPITELE